MAQLLEEFEKTIEGRIPEDVASDFKAMTRRKINALAVDACDVMNLEGMAINGAAQDIKDRLYVDGRPPTREVRE